MKIKPCQKENHYHVFWGCIGLAHYWETVRDSMEKVLKIKFDFCFQALYLGLMPATDSCLLRGVHVQNYVGR